MNKKLAKATLIFGYIFIAITIAGAAIVINAYIKGRSNDLPQFILFLLFLAMGMVIVYIVFSSVYSSLLIAKSVKIDTLINKKAKTIDLVIAIINIALTIISIVMLIIRSKQDAGASDVPFITLIICFIASIVLSLFSTIYNTIQYKKVISHSANKKSH